MFKCSEFKEKDDYAKGVSLIFGRFLRKYSEDTDVSFLELFASQFSSRTFTGVRSIYASDREFFKRYCIDCAAHLDSFLHEYEVTHLMDPYVYEHKIKGDIGGRVPTKQLNIQFSYKNARETQKELDFFELNNYIYNQVHSLDHDCLVMSVPTDSYYLVSYDEKDYTIRRGFVAAITKNRMKRRGEHCLNCQKRCKPTFINGLTRLSSVK
jgi:hypothetical protein